MANDAGQTPLLGLLAGLVVMAITRGNLLAAEPPVSFRIEQTSEATCKPAQSFSTQLLRRTDRVRLTEHADAKLVFHLDVSRDAGGWHGGLILREADGTETERTVRGATCDEVISAMALIGAVLVDPNASLTPLSPQVPPFSPPALSGARSETRHRDSHWIFGAGVGIVVEGAVAPDPVAGISVLTDVALDRRSVLSPLFGLALNHTLADREETPSGVARFQWSALRFVGCPARWPARGALLVRPCALFDAGVLDASGEQTDRARSSSAFWVSTGGLARLEAEPVRPLRLLLELGLVVPLGRDHFYFDPESPETVAFDVPSLGAMGRFAVLTQFE